VHYLAMDYARISFHSFVRFDWASPVWDKLTHHSS
ncbi:MAG: hypothetical protein ACI846_000553, partial [Pseudoalteromonas distincta]